MRFSAAPCNRVRLFARQCIGVFRPGMMPEFRAEIAGLDKELLKHFLPSPSFVQ